MAVFLLILKIIGISLLSVIGLVIILLCLPAFVYIEYNDEPAVDIRVLFIRFRVYPTDDEKPKNENGFWAKLWKRITGDSVKNEQTDDETSKGKESKFKALFGERGVAGAISFLWLILRLLSSRFVKIIRTAVVSKFDFDLEIAGEDSSDAALRYGRLCSVIYPSLSLIFQNVRKYRHTINIRPNFDKNFEYDRFCLNATLRVYPIIIVIQAIALLLEILISETKRQVSENMSEAGTKSN